MAAPSWLIINPPSGEGNGQITFSSTEHTGRVKRSYTATVAGAEESGVDDCSIAVEQTPQSEFVTIQPSASVAKGGETLTITGTSNASKLTFSWQQEPAPSLVAPLPASFTVNSSTVTNNGEEIDGDPGATAEYSYSASIVVPENTTIESLSAVLIVTTTAGQTAQCTITQSAGDAYLYVESQGTSSTSITIPQDGSAVEVNVLSNTTWTVA